ncbi:MAG TPA: glycosyl hydrolase 115 family protein [Sphingomonas sp.]
MRIDAGVKILEPADAAGPIRKAADDLASDLQKVFGARPAIVHDPAAAGPDTIEIAPSTGGAPESFAITARAGHVVLTGADMRGTIYAIYQFSQSVLGVDPMYYWTDRAPPRRTAIAVPASAIRAYPAPVFTYRGFFLNDEDMLTGWAPGEGKDHSGISLAVMDKVYETILRLKGNMVVPGTWTFPTDPQMKAAGERGLILNQHHAIPLGMNVARWPENVPYSFSAHPEIIERGWTNAVHAYDPHQEILWSVGLRGLSDTSYASMDPSVVGNDKRQGELIGQAIAEQMKIVRAVNPDAKFVTDLWQEGARLVQEGYLKIPPEVTTVWADTGYGLLQDKGQVSRGQGMYYHVAMLNGRANQLSEMVPVDRIHSEFGRYIAAGATRYMLVNTSDIRAVAMTTRAVMDTAWGGVPQDGATGYYERWASEQYGVHAAPAVAKAYADYFKAFAHLPSGDEYGDQLFHSEARQLLLSTMVSPPYYYLPGQSPFWTPVRILGLGNDKSSWQYIGPDYVEKTSAREIANCAEAAPRWDAVWQEAKAAEALVPADRRPYYDYQMLTMTAINRDSNRILLMVSRAVRDARAGNTARAKQEALATLADFDEIKRLEQASEYGKWAHWWRGEWLVGIDETRATVEHFVKWLDDPAATLPLPVQGSSWQGYYHIMHYEGDKTVDLH